MLALTFIQPEDYHKIQENDRISVIGLNEMQPGKSLQIKITHSDSGTETIDVKHSYNAQQIEWFKAGGALNIIRAAV